jgi:hypothetical protein
MKSDQLENELDPELRLSAFLALAKVKKILAGANYPDERVRGARTASTKNSVSILKMMSKVRVCGPTSRANGRGENAWR